MNLYFLLEGEQTEIILYPKWINYILPHFSKVDYEKNAVKNNYYIFSGGGIPSIYNHTVNAIKNINDNPIYDKLIVCLDGEEIGVKNRIDELNTYIKNSGVIITSSCELIIVIQNICIETWFLGNKKIIKKTPAGQLLKDFIAHYNVSELDPEQMDKKDTYRNKADFHYSYFREILKEHNLSYRKSRPNVVLEETYLRQLEKISETNHLPTLNNLISLLYDIKAKTI
ncbi:MAG TPA: hypothetical protein VKG26_14095 [Bacteroidia bacterium]|nr:hypothetical protein [Bacteroidia bacterium]